MNQNFCFGFTSPDDRLPIGKSGYVPILKQSPPRHQPPATHVTPTSRQALAETIISLVNLKSKLPPKLQKYASFGIVPKLLLLPFALGFMALIFVLRPFVVIKFFKVDQWRIGHLISNTEIIRLNTFHASKLRKHFTIYYFPDDTRPIANKYVVQKWRNTLPTLTGGWGWLLYQLAQRISAKIFTILATDTDVLELYSSYPTNWTFTSSEIQHGKEFLDTTECKNYDFVCLLVRDSTYLEAIRPNKSFSHHDYRDSEIQTYLSAAEQLTTRGLKLFRMGHLVKEPMKSNNPQIIDYATNGMRTEFLDVYLGANCKFCISTSSGWDEIPRIFRRPVLLVNLIPIFHSTRVTRQVVIYPKLILEKTTKKVLTLNEIIDRGISQSERSANFSDAGVTIQDLSSEELVEAVTEMAQRVEGTFVETPEQKEMQAKLKHIFSTHPTLQPSPNYYPIRTKFASCFLSRYPNFAD